MDFKQPHFCGWDYNDFLLHFLNEGAPVPGHPRYSESDQALRISRPITDTKGVAVRIMRKRVKELKVEIKTDDCLSAQM